jgi:uncharacterized protein (TIGR01244 family)
MLAIEARSRLRRCVRLLRTLHVSDLGLRATVIEGIPLMSSVSDIYNFIQIDDRTATGGQPSAEQFRSARDAGFEVAVNLAPDGQETSLPGERELLEELGVEYHHIPVAWANPQVDQLHAFENVMEAVKGRRALIHCQANYRVTAFFALYAMAKRGWTEDQADALIDHIWKSNPDYLRGRYDRRARAS